MQQILTSPRPTGRGGDATPADSGADASVRLAGRTSSTQLSVLYSNKKILYSVHTNLSPNNFAQSSTMYK